MEKKPQFIPTRESLLDRLKDWNDDDGWSEFFKIYRQLIFATAIKAGLREHEAEDVVQDTVLSVAKTIKDFKYDPKKCRFKNWLGHLAQKRIADRFRKRAREWPASHADSGHRTAHTPAIERVADSAASNLDAIWNAEWQQTLLEAAVQRVKARVSAGQYQIFDFHVLKKMPVGKVTQSLGVNAAQVYLAKHRVARLLQKEIKRLDAELG